MNQIITVQFSKDTGTSYIQIYFYDLQHLKCVEDGHLHFKFAFFLLLCISICLNSAGKSYGGCPYFPRNLVMCLDCAFISLCNLGKVQ